jgi:hypothetical protein
LSSRANRAYQRLVRAGTLLLMLSIGILGSCSPAMQFTLGGAYIGLIALFLSTALLPPTLHWRLDWR